MRKAVLEKIVQVSFNGQPLFEVEDITFASPGQVVYSVAFLSGVPDVIFLHPQSRRLCVAVGEPGVIDVTDIDTMRRQEVVPTEAGRLR